MENLTLKKIGVKHIVLGLAALVFALGILVASVFETTAQTSPSYRVLTAQTEAEPSPEATVSPKPTVDYHMVYPGILPDHILYPLKMLRDKIWLWLTVEPVRKSELLLLFADKRLGAAKALVEGGKTEMGISTLTKGEKYLEQAIEQAEKAREAGKETAALYEKLAKATLKHQELLGEMVLKVPEQAQSTVKETMNYSQQGYEKVRGALERE